VKPRDPEGIGTLGTVEPWEAKGTECALTYCAEMFVTCYVLNIRNKHSANLITITDCWKSSKRIEKRSKMK